MEYNLMQNLNDEQLKAVLHKDGPLLIVAGAGTGKTTVITQKIAYMIERGWAKSDEILALTFTEKAAGEMEERVDRLLPIGYLDLWISTFHSFAQRILEAHGLEIGLPGDFKLLNEFEQWILIKKNFDKFNLNYYRPAGNPTKFIAALLKHFSRLKDEDISPSAYLKYAEDLKQNLDDMLSGNKTRKRGSRGKSQIPNPKSQINILEDNLDIKQQEVERINELADAYHIYQRLLLDNNALDFGDLINYCLKLFRERPAILAKYKNQFKYVLVDEFQDTNWAQYELVKLLVGQNSPGSHNPPNPFKPSAPLASLRGRSRPLSGGQENPLTPFVKGGNLTVVGDDDQCLPGESLVLTKGGEKRIDKIKIGEEVASAVGKGYLSYSRVAGVNAVNKSVKLLTFKTENGKAVKVTDNHKMFCFVPTWKNAGLKKEDRHFFVYLMNKQELGWRIGITNDLSVRLKLERSADRLVAVASFKTEAESRYYETYLSLKYGIPTVIFQNRGGIMEGELVNRLYRELDVERGVNNLAKDLGIDLSAHQVCLEAVNRGDKVRIKINLEMCHRTYRSKYAKGAYLQNPQVSHALFLETSHRPTIKKIEQAGFKMLKSKKGKRLRIISADLEYLGDCAKKIQKISGGIIENRCKIGKTKIVHRKALIVPAGNIFPGMYLPVVTGEGIIYEKVVERKEENKMLEVYDLEVERTHNFVANSIVVHNSIYRFRGASMSNILQFKKDFPDAEEIILTKNYRNRQNILDLSYEFIKLNNPNRLEWQLNNEASGRDAPTLSRSVSTKDKRRLNKKLIAQNEGDGEIAVIQADDLAGEARAVTEKIIELAERDKEASWNDFAILVRANDSAKEFCAALLTAGLSYQFLASRGLYAKPVIMDIIAYLKLLDDYHESRAMYRLLNLPVFKFNYQELVNFNYWAAKKSWSLFEVLKSAVLLNLGGKIQAKISQVLGLISRHSALARDKSTSEVVLAFLNDSGYLKYLTELTPLDLAGNNKTNDGNKSKNLTGQAEQKSREAIGYLNQFMKRIKVFEAAADDKSVKQFLLELEMEINAGEEGVLAPDLEAGPEAIKVMTVHGAKGLEFKYVFITNLVDLRFPTVKRGEAISIPDALVKEILPEGDVHLEEERRLFYVAMTRAKLGLYFSLASDYGGARKKKPSRFLIECNLAQTELVRCPTPHQVGVGHLKEKTADRNIFKQAEFQTPAYFSYTQLAAFSNCPYQYRFAHVLRVPVRGKGSFSFGKTLHSTLQKLFELINEKRGFGQGNLFEIESPTPSPLASLRGRSGPLSGGQENPLTPFVKGGKLSLSGGKNPKVELEEILSLYEKSWIDDWYESKKQKEEFRARGKEILTEFYSKHKDNWPPALFTEKAFKMKVANDGVRYTVRGVMDRIDRSGDKLKIIDYKTGRPKDKLTFEEKEQLLIYQLAVIDLYPDEEIGNVAFYYLDNNSEMEFLGTAEELNKVKDKIVSTIGEIKKSVFLPRPSQLCRHCDFFEICEYRQN